jgi:hypothetical protein
LKSYSRNSKELIIHLRSGLLASHQALERHRQPCRGKKQEASTQCHTIKRTKTGLTAMDIISLSPPLPKKRYFIGSLDSSYTRTPHGTYRQLTSAPPLPASSLLTLTDSCLQFGSPGCWRERPMRGVEAPLEAGQARGKCW